MTMNTSDANKAFLPEQVHNLITQPVTEASVATQVAQVVHTDLSTNFYRVPVVTADPTAEWVAEGAEIAATHPSLSEESSPFFKLAGLTIISRELADDPSPEAAQIVGQGLARDIARKLDLAYFGTKGLSVITPPGLEDLTGVNTITTGTAWTNTDPFAEAIYAAEATGATLNAFIANPAAALLLAQVKKATGSNEPLLGNDPTQPTRRTIAGVPLLISPAVTAGTIWGNPATRTIIAIRQDVDLQVDRSVFFTSDRVAIRATLRAAFLYPHAAAVQKITLGS